MVMSLLTAAALSGDTPTLLLSVEVSALLAPCVRNCIRLMLPPPASAVLVPPALGDLPLGWAGDTGLAADGRFEPWERKRAELNQRWDMN